MRHTRIVTSFVTHGGRLLLLRRSRRVKTMRGLWSGVSGVIEGDEEPLERAKIEIFEEAGIRESDIRLLRSADVVRVDSPQYRNHEWEVFPFLFESAGRRVVLNWENSDFRWVGMGDIAKYKTVPSLGFVLSRLL